MLKERSFQMVINLIREPIRNSAKCFHGVPNVIADSIASSAVLLENSSKTVYNNIKKFIHSTFTVIREFILNILDPGKNDLMNS